jgi:dephospho-CoA kinase
LRIGLTGGIGAGKSTVSACFAKRGAKIISSDKIAQEILDRPQVQIKLVELFGEEAVNSGKTDRKVLSEQVFLEPELRLKLEAIVHPLVRAEVIKEFAAVQPGEVAINEVPLLFEVGLEKNYDLVISVVADQETRIQRAMQRGMSRADVVSRLSVQVLDEERIKKSDLIIENNRTLSELEKQVDSAWQQILSLVKS